MVLGPMGQSVPMWRLLRFRCSWRLQLVAKVVSIFDRIYNAPIGGLTSLAHVARPLFALSCLDASLLLLRRNSGFFSLLASSQFALSPGHSKISAAQWVHAQHRARAHIQEDIVRSIPGWIAACSD